MAEVIIIMVIWSWFFTVYFIPLAKWFKALRIGDYENFYVLSAGSYEIYQVSNFELAKSVGMFGYRFYLKSDKCKSTCAYCLIQLDSSNNIVVNKLEDNTVIIYPEVLINAAMSVFSFSTIYSIVRMVILIINFIKDGM